MCNRAIERAMHLNSRQSPCSRRGSARFRLQPTRSAKPCSPAASKLESLVTIQAREPNSGLVVIPNAFKELHLPEIVSLAVRYRVPAINWSRSFTEGGGLISYGPYLVDEYRRAATYADRILKGSKPSELPVQAPVKFELVVNLKTAKALGLDVPPSPLAIADEVIE
jgi:putative tryptophan/tyrosine transport system substrate-binding protein